MSLINEALKKAERERFGPVPHSNLSSPDLGLAHANRVAHGSTDGKRHSVMIVLLLLISCCMGAFLAYLVSLHPESSPRAERDPIFTANAQITSTEMTHGGLIEPASPGTGSAMDGHACNHDLSESISDAGLPTARISDPEMPKKQSSVSLEIARFLAERIRIQMVIPSSQRLLVLSDDGVTNVTIRAGELVPAPYLVYFSKIDEGVIVFTDGMGGEYRKSF